MLNKYPWWKYLLIFSVLILGVIYALPNLYPSDPAIQIRPQSVSEKLAQHQLDLSLRALDVEKIAYQNAQLEGSGGLIRLQNFSDQLKAKDVIRRVLGDGYVVALNMVETTPKWLQSIGAGPLKLGLDLSGGVHFLLQVDMQKAVDSRLKLLEADVKAALREVKIRYKSLPIASTKANNSLILAFSDSESLERAKTLIAKDFQQFSLGSSAQPNSLHLTLNQVELDRIQSYAIEQNLSTVRKRVNELGVSEPLVQRQGKDRIIVELPGVQDTATAKRILGKTASLEFRLAAKSGASSSSVETFDFNGQPVALERNIILTGDQVSNAGVGYDEQGQPQVSVDLDSLGGEKMMRATRDSIGRGMAVLFIEQRPVTQYQKVMVNGKSVDKEIQSTVEDRKVISVATIQSVLGSSFRITGLDSPAESSELALLLRAGGLAAPMFFAEERTLGPSLGEENIKSGFIAAVWGFIFVSLFMMVIYRFFGVIATLALALNMVLLIALLSMFGATLTLPGIAGIVLTMGMAVDANVLIFSRIKEEVASGQSPQKAINEGFSRALSAITDANLTTLLVGIILYGLGSGPVKGFAVTMSLGIFTSMFTAIYVTRAMVNLTHGGRSLKKLWI